MLEFVKEKEVDVKVLLTTHHHDGELDENLTFGKRNDAMEAG